MLKSMRESFHHLRWILIAVVAAFVFGFVFIDMGLGGASIGGQDNSSNFAARVNGDTISLQELNRAIYYAEENYKRMYGGQFTPEMAEQMGLHRQVLDSLIDQRLLLQEAAKLELEATPTEIQKRILQMPVLAPEGKFVGTELYGQYVRQLGYANPAAFEDELAKDITVSKMESALASSIMVSRARAEEEYRRANENAKIRYVLYPGAREMDNVTVTPAEVEAFYKANQSRYTHAEQRNLKYLVADIVRLRAQIKPSEDEIRQRYESAKETEFKRPEQARIHHILVKVEPGSTPEVDAAAKAKAESLVKQLRAGGDFGALAREHSGDPSSSSNGGDMGMVDRGATVEPFDRAAFSIALNTVSDPIKTEEYGYHIIKVLERTSAGYRPLEEVRSMVASQIVGRIAQDRAREEITRIAAQMKQKKPASPAEFQAFANERVSSNETQWFARSQPIPGLGPNEPLATWAFGANANDVSDVIGTRRGPAIAFLMGTRPAGVSPLADVRARVEADLKAERAADLAAKKVAEAVQGATYLEDVASKLTITPAETTITRGGFITGFTGDTTALVDAALTAPPSKVSGPVKAGDGAVAFIVSEQKRVTPDELKTSVPQYIETIRQRDARALRSSLLQRLRKQAKVEVNDEAVQQLRGGAQGV